MPSIAVLAHHRFQRTTLILIFLLAILLGIGAARAGLRGDIFVLVFSCLLSVLLMRKSNIFFVVALASSGLLLGALRGSYYIAQTAHFSNLYYKSVELSLVADEDAAYNKTKQLSFRGRDIYLSNGQHLVGKVMVSGFGANALYEGDRLKVKGKLYPGYGAYQGRISFALLSVSSRRGSLISDFRRRFSAGVETALPEPLSPFAMGILVGQRAALPDYIKQDLLKVGLTHIIAVSGYNLTIILEACKKLLGKSSKRIATFISLALITTFLLIAGTSASIVRAAIVSVLSVAAGYYGRSIKPVLLIIMTAVITSWANPVYVWSDISWYLSFLAFFGVLVLAPIIKTRFESKVLNSLIGSIALESLCAEVMTMPYVVHMFGQMSLIGLLANVLIVSFVPLAMLLSLVAGLAGMIYAAGSSLIAWPAILLLNAMLDTSHLLANIPGIFVEGITLSLSIMITLYLLVGFMYLVLRHKTKRPKYVNITDINDIKQTGVLA